jgi:hypothetical protein
MKQYLCLLYFCHPALVTAQSWDPPLPPLPMYQCENTEIRSEPVASYRISALCDLQDIQQLGDYQEGIAAVLDEIQDFRTTAVTRRLVDGQFRYLQEVRIELRKLFADPGVLVCHLDMFGNNLLDAAIEYQVRSGTGKMIAREEKLELEGNKLPDLGVFTHGKTIIRAKDCPGESGQEG